MRILKITFVALLAGIVILDHKTDASKTLIEKLKKRAEQQKPLDASTLPSSFCNYFLGFKSVQTQQDYAEVANCIANLKEHFEKFNEDYISVMQMDYFCIQYGIGSEECSCIVNYFSKLNFNMMQMSLLLNKLTALGYNVREYYNVILLNHDDWQNNKFHTIDLMECAYEFTYENYCHAKSVIEEYKNWLKYLLNRTASQCRCTDVFGLEKISQARGEDLATYFNLICYSNQKLQTWDRQQYEYIANEAAQLSLKNIKSFLFTGHY